MTDNFMIHPIDRNTYGLQIKSKIKNQERINIFTSFTYITPNYSILFTLNELKNLLNSINYRLTIVVWDMNIVANPYFKRLCSSNKVNNTEQFINQKIAELMGIVNSVGLKKDSVLVYKSSDLWKRLISYDEENLFQYFLSVLARLRIKDYVSNRKVSHLVQIPLDLFFCNYFHKLYPEDELHEIDLIFFGSDRNKLSLSTRELMFEEGLINTQKPIFILLKNFPYLIYNYNMPDWDMNKDEIKEILVNSKISKPEIFQTLRYIASSVKDKIKIKNDNIDIEVDYDLFSKRYCNKSRDYLLGFLVENLFLYLQRHKKRFIENKYVYDERVFNISSRKEAKDIGSVLRSSIALEILILANGSKTITQMAKELKKSIPTISMYANKLKKMGFLRILSNKTLKRNIKGVKINLEQSI
ncbi:MAG: ArsR family transcriptional regulator [Nanoarchaeota archaeon]